MMTIHVIFHLNWGCPFSDKLIYLVIHTICVYIYIKRYFSGVFMATHCLPEGVLFLEIGEPSDNRLPIVLQFKT